MCAIKRLQEFADWLDDIKDPVVRARLIRIMETRLSLRYSGPAVDAGAMDVYAASANMIAFSEFMVAAVKTTYGGTAEARAEVAGFGRGSFVTDLVFNVVGPAASMLATFSSEHLLDIVKEAFALWKHLMGEPPAAIQLSGENNVAVTNNNGKIIQVRADTVNLVFSDKGSESAFRFVHEALSQDGVSRVDLGSNGIPIAAADQDEAAYFVPVAKSDISENVNRMSLILVSATFQEGNKWRFNDGSLSFSAAILDEDFISRVNNGERFGKGDVLDVELRVKQVKTGSKITSERQVLKVFEHRVASIQLSLIAPQ